MTFVANCRDVFFFRPLPAVPFWFSPTHISKHVLQFRNISPNNFSWSFPEFSLELRGGQTCNNQRAKWFGLFLLFFIKRVLIRRRTNVQQLTCKIVLSSSFYYLFLSFVLLELKPFVLKGKSRGKNYEKL